MRRELQAARSYRVRAAPMFGGALCSGSAGQLAVIKIPQLVGRSQRQRLETLLAPELQPTCAHDVRAVGRSRAALMLGEAVRAGNLGQIALIKLLQSVGGAQHRWLEELFALGTSENLRSSRTHSWTVARSADDWRRPSPREHRATCAYLVSAAGRSLAAPMF